MLIDSGWCVCVRRVHCKFCPLCPLFITRDVAVCSRPTDTQTKDGQTHRQRQTWSVGGLTGSERVVNRTGDPSLPGEQRSAQAHIVRGVSDAELGQQQLPARPLHLRLSVLLRPSAGWGGSGSPGTVTYGRACSLCVSGEAPNSEINGNETAAVSLEQRPCSGFQLGMFFWQIAVSYRK